DMACLLLAAFAPVRATPRGVEHRQPWLPARRHPRGLPARKLALGQRIARGEVLRAVIARPAFAAARAHAPAGAAALVDERYVHAGLGERARTTQAGDAGADHGVMERRVHVGIHRGQADRRPQGGVESTDTNILFLSWTNESRITSISSDNAQIEQETCRISEQLRP